MNQNTLGFAAGALFANFLGQNNQVTVSFGQALEYLLAWGRVHCGSVLHGVNQLSLRALLLGLLFNLYPSRLSNFYGFTEGYLSLSNLDEIHLITKSTTSVEYYIFRLGNMNRDVHLNLLISNHNQAMLMHLTNVHRVHLVNIFQNTAELGDFNRQPFRVFCSDVQPTISADVGTLRTFHDLHTGVDQAIFRPLINPIRSLTIEDFLPAPIVGTRFFIEQLNFLETHVNTLRLVLTQNHIMYFNLGALVCYQVQMNLQVVLRHANDFQTFADITIMPLTYRGSFVTSSTPTTFHIDPNTRGHEDNFLESHLLPSAIQTESHQYCSMQTRINTNDRLRTTLTTNVDILELTREGAVFKTPFRWTPL